MKPLAILRLTSLPLSLLLAVGCGAGSDSDQLPLGIRHVVLISVDTLRADHLGCYGNELVQSPALDGLAEEGVLFAQCISAAPTTLASHTSLFTGKYPHTHGVPRNGFHVPDENQMLPELLAEHGFHTAGFVGAAPLDPDVNFHQGFEEYDASFSVTKGLREGLFQRPANEVTDAALGWLDGRDANEDERLFLFLHYYDPHPPYVFPEPWAGMYSGSEGEPDASMDGLKKVRAMLAKEGRAPDQPPGVRAREEGFGRRLQERAGPGLEEAQRLAAEYAAGVTFTDHHLGRLLEGLRDRGLLDETLVAVTSDHGETLFEHVHPFSHGPSVFDSVSRVPWILRLPGSRFAGSRIETVVSNIDVLPTLLSLLELPVPGEVEGVDVSAELSGQRIERAPVFTEATMPRSDPKFNADPVWPNNGKFQSIRTSRYKYMFRLPDERFRLYDLHSDPDEQRNLLAEGLGFDDAVRANLDEALLSWREQANPLSADVTDSKAQLDALEALGYAGEEEED